MDLFGRTVIYTDETEITRKNILDVIDKAMEIHKTNQAQIEKLYDYFKGDQDILQRTKDIRPDILNNVCANRCYETVLFKTGYLVGEPIQYISRSMEDKTDDIALLNRYMEDASKDSLDELLVKWFHIAGTAYRAALPPLDNEADVPFRAEDLDPRSTFVVYSSSLGHAPMLGVTITAMEDDSVIYSAYTKTEYFLIKDDEIKEHGNHIMGDVPIVEYPLNEERMGAFEPIISLQDALNKCLSNKLDGIEQFVQALLVLQGIDIEDQEEVFANIEKLRGIVLPENGDAKYLVQELNQTQTQTVVDNLYQTMLDICGMPNRNGGSSTSDTGIAVVYRDGWESAEARAKSTERIFKLSERRFLKLILNLTNSFAHTDLSVGDIDIRFTRRNYDNIATKVQVLDTMLNNPKIADKLAFDYCGMFADPNLAYMLSKAEYEENNDKEQKELMQFTESQTAVSKEQLNV